MRTTSALLFLVLGMLGAQALAQNEVLPPQTSTAAQHTDDSLAIAPSKVAKPRIIDRKFLLLSGIAATATVLDVVTTSHCLSTYPTCQEGNPLVGSHPSTAQLYGISFSVLGAELLASAWLRREMPHRKLWMIPPIAAAAGHGVAAALNLRTIHRLGESPSQ